MTKKLPDCCSKCFGNKKMWRFPSCTNPQCECHFPIPFPEEKEITIEWLREMAEKYHRKENKTDAPTCRKIHTFLDYIQEQLEKK